MSTQHVWTALKPTTGEHNRPGNDSSPISCLNYGLSLAKMKSLGTAIIHQLDTLTPMFVCLFVSIDQATWFYGKPISRLLLVLPSVSLSVLIPF
jgi:hypothetical protein